MGTGTQTFTNHKFEYMITPSYLEEYDLYCRHKNAANRTWQWVDEYSSYEKAVKAVEKFKQQNLGEIL